VNSVNGHPICQTDYANDAEKIARALNATDDAKLLAATRGW